MMNEKGHVPEGYKETEIGVIPIEWKVEKIDHFCEVKTGGTPSTKNKDYWDGEIPWMSSGEINKKFVYNIEKKITQKGLENSNARILPADSVMMALNGQGKTRGSVAVLKIPSTCNQSLACMIPNQKITHFLYLFYNLQSRYSEIRNYTGDTGREGLNLKIIKDMNVPLPTLPEQQKIASILSKVDEQIEQTEQIIEKTEILKKGLMQRLLTKGIGHTKFKKTELGEIPEEWGIVKIQTLIDKDIIFPNQDGNHGELHPKSTDYVIEGIPFIMVNNLSKNLIDLTNCKKISLEQANSLRIEPSIKGDVLISHKGTIGRTAIVQDSKYPFVVLTPQVTYYRVKNADKLYSLYLYYVFNSPYFQKMMNEFSKQSTRDFISISNQRKLNLILPESIKEQQKIASILSKVDSQIQNNQNYLTKLQELKKGLMQDLLTGKVRVRK